MYSRCIRGYSLLKCMNDRRRRVSVKRENHVVRGAVVCIREGRASKEKTNG